MECKNCGASLEENQTICPDCGEDNQVKPPKKKLSKKAKISIIAVSVVVSMLLSIVGVGLCLLKPWQNDVFNREKYLASDFWANAARDQVVATMGDYQLTNGRLQVFLWMHVYDLINYYIEQYGEYAVYYLGIDLSKPLDEQIYNEETGMTWEQYFLDAAFYTWNRYQAMVDEAKKAGFQMPAESQKELAELHSSLEADAKEQGYNSGEELLQAQLGKTVTFEDYYYYLEMCWMGNAYFNEMISKLAFTDAELEAFYEKNKESLEGYGVFKDDSLLVDFRNILIKPVATKNEDGKSVITDEAWETCRQKAQEIMDTLQSKELSEEVFAELAKNKSEDKNTASNGGLYQYVGKNDLATVDVRHILIMPESSTGSTYTEEEWEACRIKAQALLDQYLAGEKTEAVFGAMANEHSQDQNGKVTNGGLYADVYVGQMVKPFEEWIFDGSRKAGDTGLVKTQYGYHVMYFVDRNGPVDDWAFAEGRKAGDTALIKTEDGYQVVYYVGDAIEWKVWCQDGLQNETAESMMQSYTDARPIDVRYWAVVLSQRAETE